MITVNAVASEGTNLTLKTQPLAANHTFAQMGFNHAEDVATQEISFEDFLDAINPLQHIPVLSSLYRGLTGESINPVSRIAGDALYGGVFGLASAAMSGAGALADEIVAANNGGQRASEFLIASVLGSGAGETQIADASPALTAQAYPQASANAALFQTPATQSPILHMPDLKQTASADAPTTTIAEAGSSPSAPSGDAAKGMPIDRSKMAYGGVMDSAMMASAKQNQALALALAGNHSAFQAQRALHNSRFETAPAASAVAESKAADETSSALQSLLNDLQISKGVRQYKNAAQSTPVSDNAVNIVN